MRAMLLRHQAPPETDPLRLAEVAEPEPAAAELLLEVLACGVCHTDLHIVRGDLPMPRPELIPGHQIVGRVLATGPGVTDHQPGVRVGVPWLSSACGSCQQCVAGLENLCPDARFTGYHRDGGFAERVVVPASAALQLPDAFDDLQAAPLLCAGIIGYRSLRLSGIAPGQRLGLFGFGASAHLTLQLARAQGIDVFVFTRSQRHQELALELGASWAGSVAEEAPSLVHAAVTFAPAGWLVPEALRRLHRGGTLAINAIHLDKLPELDYTEHLYWERCVRSVANLTRRDGREFLELAARIPLRSVVRAFPLRKANRVLQLMAASELDGAAALVPVVKSGGRRTPRVGDSLRKTALTLLLVAMVACWQEEIVPEPYLPTDAWDAYCHGLVTAGLDATALGRDWIEAGERALSAPVGASLPYAEAGAFDPRAAHAVGYRFGVDRGQRVEAAVQLGSQASARVYLDLFRLGQAGPVHVASSEAGSSRLAFEPRRDAEYVLRLQPELLRGGRYSLELRQVASLEFPVEDHDITDIQSGFGAARDAGRRSHHGVDIFAPRNTPVLAASRARVRRVGEQRLGGNVIWLYDEARSLNLYYAHLESQAVQGGEWVVPGQVIGAVGNSGNARTTPTHLHFAIYARGEGPLDPDTFLRQPRTGPPALRADPSIVGSWAVTAAHRLRAAPTQRAGDLARLGAETPVRIWAATGSYYRVALADGSAGFLAASQLLRSSASPTAGSE